MAVGCNKFSFVSPGHIFEWNLMRLCMGPLFDMLYREKWSNSVRRTVLRPTKPATVFLHVLAIWSRSANKFLRENFHQKHEKKRSPVLPTGRPADRI